MGTIRPVERGELDEVAALVRTGIAGWNRDSRLLALTLLEDPWTPDPPRSLVALDDTGRVIGSIGAQRRRLLFDGKELDAVAVSHLVVAPDGRGAATGALLVRTLLSGDQALTFTDSSTPEVTRIWRLFGGQADATRCSEYMLVTRAGRWLGGMAREIARGHPISHRNLPVAALPLHAARAALRSRTHQGATPGLSCEAATPAELTDVDRGLDRRVRLRVAHDPAYLEARFSQLESINIGGELVRRVVRQAGRPVGWFAYIARPHVSRVLAVSADADNADAVFDALIADATERGTAVVSGRSAPHLAEPLRRRMAVLRHSPPPLIHAPDPELRASLASSSSVLEELELLDSEWW